MQCVQYERHDGNCYIPADNAQRRCDGYVFSGRLSERCRVINSYISLVQSMSCYIGFSGYKLAEIFRAEQKAPAVTFRTNLLNSAKTAVI